MAFRPNYNNDNKFVVSWNSTQEVTRRFIETLYNTEAAICESIAGNISEINKIMPYINALYKMVGKLLENKGYTELTIQFKEDITTGWTKYFAALNSMKSNPNSDSVKEFLD